MTLWAIWRAAIRAESYNVDRQKGDIVHKTLKALTYKVYNSATEKSQNLIAKVRHVLNIIFRIILHKTLDVYVGQAFFNVGNFYYYGNFIILKKVINFRGIKNKESTHLWHSWF